MRYLAAILLLTVIVAPSFAEDPAGPSFNYRAWRYLPVQDGGRRKPLDTLAWETFRTLSNRASFIHPETGRKLDATAWYLALVFEWKGWDERTTSHGRQEMDSPRAQESDAWDNTALVRLESLELERALGIAEGQKFISPEELGQSTFRDPATKKQFPFLYWAEMLEQKGERNLTPLERKGYELAGRLMLYRDLRAGRRWEVAPLKESTDQQWLLIADLMQANFDDTTDPTGQLRKAKDQFRQARAAYLSDSPDAFDQATTAFLATLRDLGPQLGVYPSEMTINLEVAYNHWRAFPVCVGADDPGCPKYAGKHGDAMEDPVRYRCRRVRAALVAMLAGFVMRISISGRAPVTNMYESVIYLALGTALLGLIFELTYRKGYVLTAAAAVATVALVLADNCPAVLDPACAPCNPCCGATSGW